MKIVYGEKHCDGGGGGDDDYNDDDDDDNNNNNNNNVRARPSGKDRSDMYQTRS